jgi:Spx/MgsR family transcriptional regulator
VIKIYGIPNCDTMKKARRWLDDNGVAYSVHDYKKLGVPEKDLRRWVKQAGWEALLNRRGTTWRRLDESVRNGIDTASAIRIMLEHPAIIKRPVVESGRTLLIGFDQNEFQKLLP